MIGKNVANLVQNLEKKKFRDKYKQFKIEGNKMVMELLRSNMKISFILASEAWANNHIRETKGVDVRIATEQEMKSFSDFQSLPDVLAIAEIPAPIMPSSTDMQKELVVVLNGIQDPGNLGTIIRVSDWFGIKHIVCDADCASIYNSKAVQASMGAIFRVSVSYTNLSEWIKLVKTTEFQTFGAFLEGENIYKQQLPQRGVIIMGNEGHGISKELESLTDHKITIPTFANSEFHSESLNVGVATGIILSEFRRS